MARDDLLKFSATLQLNSRSKAFANKSTLAVEDAMRKVLKAAKKKAQENVAKGKGPSPHDGSADGWGHRFAHEDTGDLAESVQDAIWLQGFLTEGTIYTELDYGVYLEVGWRTKQKNFYRYPWLKPAFLESLKLLPKYAAESMKFHMSNLEEDEILDDDGVESWAAAAERWSRDMKALAEQKKDQKEIPEPYNPKFTNFARHLHASGYRNKGGRPKDPTELGEEMELDRRRAANKKRVSDNAEKFDTKLARRARRSTEQNRRASIDPNKAAESYEQKAEELRQIQDKQRRELRLQQQERKAEAERRQQEAERKLKAVRDGLDKANAKLKGTTTTNVKAPKPKRTPGTRKKKK